jgi:hypothetical protein
MINALPTRGFDADLQTVNHDGLVVLHEWNDGTRAAYDSNNYRFLKAKIIPRLIN